MPGLSWSVNEFQQCFGQVPAFSWHLVSCLPLCSISAAYEQGIELLLIFKAGSLWHQLHFSWLLQTNKTFFEDLWKFGRSLTFLTACTLQITTLLYFPLPEHTQTLPLLKLTGVSYIWSHVWVAFQTVFPCNWIVSQFWNNQKDLNCWIDLFLCWDRNEMKQAQAKIKKKKKKIRGLILCSDIFI